MEKLGFLKYKVNMRILFTAFLILFFATTHGVVDSSHMPTDNIHISADNQDFEPPQMHQIVTSKTHNKDCIQSGIGHSASSCSMDSKVFSSFIGAKKPIFQNIKWYLQFDVMSQDYSDHLLRPPII